jgi:Conjugal transfer protein TraD
MRKPRDFDAELQALEHKTKSLKERRVRQLGELVAATGADALDTETLAGGLLAMMEAVDPGRKESWRKRGQAFFQRRPRGAARSAQSGDAGAAAGESNAASA